METVIRYAPAASNYSDYVGYMVYESAIAAGKPRATLAVDGSVLPLGIITDAEDELGGRLVIQNAGRGRVKAGGALTPGTTKFVMANAGSKAIAGVSGNYILGRCIQETVAADADLIDVMVEPMFFTDIDASDITGIATNAAELLLLPAQIKSGVVALTGQGAVAFTTAFADTNYAIQLSLEITDATTPNGWEGLVGVINKAVGGFTVEFYDSTLTAVVPTTVAVTVHWTATAYLNA